MCGTRCQKSCDNVDQWRCLFENSCGTVPISFTRMIRNRAVLYCAARLSLPGQHGMVRHSMARIHTATIECHAVPASQCERIILGVAYLLCHGLHTFKDSYSYKVLCSASNYCYQHNFKHKGFCTLLLH